MQNSIRRLEPLKVNPKIDLITASDAGAVGTVAFDDHMIKLVGIGAPVPRQVLKKTVGVSHWSGAWEASIASHNAQILCIYEGQNPDPIEQYIALYKVAVGFQSPGMRAVINEAAWLCHPPAVLSKSFNTADQLGKARQTVSLVYWTGFLKFIKPTGGIWFTTKGNHLFGVCDFAYLGENHSEGSATFDMFYEIFNYAYQNKVPLNVGETLQIGNEVFLKFEAVSEYPEFLNSPNGTLVLTKISSSQNDK